MSIAEAVDLVARIWHEFISLPTFVFPGLWALMWLFQKLDEEVYEDYLRIAGGVAIFILFTGLLMLIHFDGRMDNLREVNRLIEEIQATKRTPI